MHSPMHDFFVSAIGKTGLNRYIIPGTSIKGVLRNVLEIISFGKMSRVSDQRYSLRDLYNRKAYTDKLTSGAPSKLIPMSQSGWLKKNGKQWFLKPCKFARVEQSDISKAGQGFPQDRCSAVDKYTRYRGAIANVPFSVSSQRIHSHKNGSIKIVYDKVNTLGEGSLTGNLVFTGQPNYKKHMEFIFYDECLYNIDVTNLKKDFEFIHSDPSSGKPNPEWEFWREKLERGERVPVFYLTAQGEAASGTSFPESMGLAMMYRLPYALTIGDAVRETNPIHFPRNTDEFKPDMADLIFGYCQNGKALRGRVHVGHFQETEESLSIRNGKTIETLKAVLGSPKPTFYPNYLEQRHVNGVLVDREDYVTYMDKGKARVRGWKRYPTTAQDDQPSAATIPKIPNDNEDMTVLFRPLPKETTFRGKIRFHNLKQEELGAILWTLTWGGNGNCHHQIGMAKPLGFGRIKITLDMDKSRIIHPEEAHIDRREAERTFIEYMEKELGGSWKKSEQLNQLLAMADSTVRSSVPLEYPKLTVKPNLNEFAVFKKERKVLRAYLEPAKSGQDNSRQKSSGAYESNTRATVQQHNSTVRTGEATEPTDPFENLIKAAKNLQPKELKKELDRINTLVPEQLQRLKLALQKRNDWSVRDTLRAEFSWPDALKKLDLRSHTK